jgi:hypothetical protein
MDMACGLDGWSFMAEDVKSCAQLLTQALRGSAPVQFCRYPGTYRTATPPSGEEKLLCSEQLCSCRVSWSLQRS